MGQLTQELWQRIIVAQADPLERAAADIAWHGASKLQTITAADEDIGRTWIVFRDIELETHEPILDHVYRLSEIEQWLPIYLESLMWQLRKTPPRYYRDFGSYLLNSRHRLHYFLNSPLWVSQSLLKRLLRRQQAAERQYLTATQKRFALEEYGDLCRLVRELADQTEINLPLPIPSHAPDPDRSALPIPSDGEQ